MGHTATGTRAGADRMDSTDHGSVRVITTLKYLLSLSVLGSLWAYKVRTAVSEARVNRRSEEADCSQAEKASVKTQSLRQDQKHNRVSYFYISCGYFPLLNRSTPTPPVHPWSQEIKAKTIHHLIASVSAQHGLFTRTAANGGEQSNNSC